MAGEAAVTTRVEEPGDLHDEQSGAPSAGEQATRAWPKGPVVLSNAERSAPYRPESAVTTAEIPVVRAREPLRLEQVRFDVQSHLPPRRRRPAPVGLRVLVGVLAVLVVCAAVGLVAEHYHPNWFKALRANAGLASTPAPKASRPKASPAGFRLVSSSAGNSTYEVPSSSYSITVTPVSAAWVTVRSPAKGGPLVFAKTLRVGTPASPIELNKSSSLIVSAQVRTIEIASASKHLGTITSPVVGTTYTFEPATS